MSVFKLKGELISILIDKQIQASGTYTVTFDGSHLGSDFYFYRLTAEMDL